MPINDNLILSESALQGLYGRSLYTIEENNAKKVKAEKQEVIRTSMTIITRLPLEKNPEDPLFRFLSGIVQACKLSLTDIHLVSSQNDHINFKFLEDNSPSPLVLMFDVTPVDMGLPVFFPSFQLQNYSGITYLSGPGLQQLEADKLLKSKLWLCLKQFYNL